MDDRIGGVFARFPLSRLALHPLTPAIGRRGRPLRTVPRPGTLDSLLSVLNVGTASARATYAGDANHAGSAGTASFTIAAAPPARNPIVNPGPQVSHEGDKVELRIHLIGAGGKHHDDDSRPRGSFAASGLPPQLHMEGRQGVIRGHIRKGGDAGPSGKREYQSTVTFTRNSVTYSQSFRWTVLDSHKKHKKGDSDHKDGEDGRQGR